MPNTDSQIEVLLTANFSELQTGMTGAAVAVKSGTDAMGASFVDFTRDAETLDNILKQNIKTFADLAESESALDALQRQGMISTEELTVAFDHLAKAESVLSKEAAKSAVALTEQAGATVVLGGAVSGVTRELAVMLGETMRGNYTRLIGSTTVLANRTGLLAKVFTPLGAAIGVTALGVGAFGYQVYEAEKVQSQFNSALLMSNYASGLSLDGVNQLRDGIHAATGDMGASNEAMLAMVKSGKFTADQMLSVGRASVEMSKMTGDAVGKVVKDFESLQHDPVNAVVKLNSEYHFLTVSVFDQIDALAKQGKSQEAAKVGIDAFANSIHQAALREEADAGSVLKAWRATAEFFGNVKGMIGDIGTPDAKFRGLLEAQATLNERMKEYKANNNPFTQEWIGNRTQDEERLKSVNAQIAAIRAQAKAADDLAAKKGNDDKKVQTVIEETSAHEKLVASLKSESKAREIIADEKARLESIHKLDPNAAGVKGFSFDASGQIQATKQWTDEVAKLEKKYSDVKSGASAAAKAARKAASEAMVDLEQQRIDAQANGDSLHEIDQKILDSATKLYGQRSKEHKAAYKQMEADDLAYWRSQAEQMHKALEDGIKYDEETLKGEHDAAVEAIALKKQDAEGDYRNGQINALQKLAIEKKLAADLFAVDKSYYANLAALRSGDTMAAATADNAISKAHAKELKSMKKADTDYQAAIRAQWKQTADTIAQSIASSTQSMIFHGQTLKQSLVNVAESIAGAFISYEEKKLAKWILTNVLGQASDEVTSTESITSSAAEAGAAGVASMAGAPWPLDMGAPEFGASMYGAAMSFNMTHAAGGWGRVPFDGAPAILHKDETVLPAKLAKLYRDGAPGGGGGGAVHFHAIDAQSIKEFFRRNPGALAQGIKNAHRMGHMARLS